MSAIYNSRFPQRSDKQLKKLWDNLKNRTRKLDTEHTYKILKTGGGPPPPQPANDPITEEVRRIVPTISYQIENPYDSNNVLIEEIESSENHNILIEVTNAEEKENMQPIEPTQPIDTTTDQQLTTEQRKRKKKLENRQKSKVAGVIQSRNRLIDLEARLRVKKIKDAIKQQVTLHLKRMSVLQTEKNYWERKS
ncbi:hypothetical protein ABEB36_015614 [Hypothenemus hampei]|uniref:Regulatory protein zeste n=1 Tax=Hypothenemus hampei TaxID=57062 RepID=A0ABD1DZ78_HYPHA